MLDFYGYKNFLVIGTKFILFKILNFVAVNVFNGKFPGTFSVEHILSKKKLKIIQIRNINASGIITATGGFSGAFGGDPVEFDGEDTTW